jgi:hypothetical protein
MIPLSEWQTLFAVQAGAAATLTGLVFVAVSINLAKIIVYPGLTARAAESNPAIPSGILHLHGAAHRRTAYLFCCYRDSPRLPTILGGSNHGAGSLCQITLRTPATMAGHQDCPDAACQHSVLCGCCLPPSRIAHRSLLAGTGVRLLICGWCGECVGIACRGSSLTLIVFPRRLNVHSRRFM